MRVRLLLILLVVMALFAGCGGDGGGDAGDSSETSAATTEVGAGDASDGEDDDEALAEEAALKLSDFPSGWTEGDKPDDDDQDGDDSDETFAGCPELKAEADAIEELETAEADSPQFVRGETTFVDSSVTVWEDEEAADRAFALLERDDVSDCLAQSAQENLQESGAEGIEFGQPVAQRSSAPDAGDESAAFQITLPVTAEGTEVVFYIDLIAVRSGRAGVTLTLTNLGEPFDGALAQQLAGRVAERLAP